MRWIAVTLIALSLLAPARAETKYGPSEVAQLLDLAQSEKEPEARRAKAIRALEHTDLRTQMGVLRRLLREERSLDIRLSAACTLAALGDTKAPRDLLLATAYDAERTPNCTRGEVLLSLGRIKEPAGELHLAKALHSEAPPDEPDFYANTCRALLLLDTPGARKLLFEALRDGSAPVRLAAIQPLGTLALKLKDPDHSRAHDAIVAAARQDPDEKVAEQAATALFWGGVDPAALFKLLESDAGTHARVRAARVLNQHSLGPTRVERLKSDLKREKDPEVRSAIEATLNSQAQRSSAGSRSL